MKKLSIIIPARNEEKNLRELVKRINKSLGQNGTEYEIIIIDDHSKDKTLQIAQKLSTKYPLFVYQKIGKPGKAQSLLEGFSYAKYDLLCMIDADLQYPPEAISKMVNRINKNTDIVVANRKNKETNFIRKFLSNGYLTIFGKLLHNFSCDVQSGMKVFKKEIVERIKLDPSPWTFDLEFLIKARNAGYTIDSIDITFAERRFGETKINLQKAIMQIGWTALKYRFKRPEIIPFHPLQEIKKGKGFHYQGEEYIHYSNLQVKQTAFHRLTNIQKLFIAELAIIFGISLFINWHLTFIILIAVLSLLYFVDLFFNLYLITRSYTKQGEISIRGKEIERYPNTFWPKYTVFCPLYKEWEVVPQFVSAMSKLDYPKNKLEIVFLLEEDDKETIRHIKKFDLPSYFKTIVVPTSTPRTKPKACNYGLQFATGKYVVIYDAEDIPDPLQLKKSVLAFKKADPSVICMQAKLNFYNPHQNFLTKLFTAEYSLWFDLILPGLNVLNAPIPLGGTSNHFLTSKLKEIKGWDSFNVTEDADLGIRIMKNNYKTAILNSTTFEEANSMFFNWVKQRSRWIKGYIQTYFVHTRPNNYSSNKTMFSKFIIFQLVVGGKVLSVFINPIMWIITILYFSFRPLLGSTIDSLFLSPVLYIAAFSMIFGNFLYLYFYLMGLAKREYYTIIPYIIFLIPIYALMMSIAAYQALYSLLYKPFHWSKTKHGLHLNYDKLNQNIFDIMPTQQLPTFALEGAN